MVPYLTENLLSFEDRSAWRQWLTDHGETEMEVWIVHYKKHTGIPSVTYNEAVEEALCFGWIDSLIKRIDDTTYKQKFTPRLKKSRWSEKNKRLARILLSEGRMTSRGLESITSWINDIPVNKKVRKPAGIPAGPGNKQ